MRIKELFTVPNGKKVTEKAFARVLISSICSILLCMACLAGTTWAWFTVSIENTGNVIQIADIPQCVIQVDGEPFSPGNKLLPDEHTVSITHASKVDDFQKKSTLYVTLIVDGVTAGRTTLHEGNGYETLITVKTDKACMLTWEVSWFPPAGAEELPDNTISLIMEEPTEPTAEPSMEVGTAATEPSTDTTTPTEATTEPSAEGTTTPTTEATEAATEAATIPTTTGETTEPTETTPVTEEPTIPAADATTVPTSIPTDTTEPVTEPDGTTSPIETG